MSDMLIMLLNLVISNPDLQAAAASPVAKGLANILPDATEDNIADFIDLVAKDLRSANPSTSPSS